VNGLKKKNQLKKVRKKENLCLLASKVVIIQELFIVIGAISNAASYEFVKF